MSQNDMAVANQTFPNFRSDMNAAFQALASMSGGTSEPTVTYAGQPWHDTTSNLLKYRNQANSAWITAAWFDTSNNRWEIRSNVIQAVSTAGVTLKNAAGTTIFAVSDTGVITAGAITAGSLAGANITVGSGKTLDVSAGTLTLADNQITGAKVVIASETTRGAIEIMTVAEFWTKTAARAMTPAAMFTALAEVNISSSGGNLVVDMDTGINFDVTLDESSTLDFSNIKEGQHGRIRVTQDATGLRLLTYSSKCQFTAGIAPVLSITASAKDYLYYEAESSTLVTLSFRGGIS